jgi:ABC-2 type transport system permease protein
MTTIQLGRPPHIEAQSGPQSSASHRASTLTGLAPLVRLTLRRERLRILLWLVGIVSLVVASAASITSLYDTEPELQKYAALVHDNTALIVQSGPGYGLDNPTTGSVLMNELAIWVFIAVALMNVFLIVRHTRTEEASQSAELTCAAPVGRHAGTAAALIGAGSANIAIAAGVTGALAALGLPMVGTVAFTASLVAEGMVFAGVAAVTAQVATNPRSALGLGGVAVAISFVLRAVGDVGDGRASWLSPIGWAQAIRAFANERWWVLVIPVVTSATLVKSAFALQARRDFGAGLVPQRAGPARAAPTLRTPLRLAVRLQRAAVLAWSVGLGLLGFFYGVVADQAASIIEENPEMEKFFAQLGSGSITDAYLATSIMSMSLVATGFAVSSVLRLRSEEVAHRADSILSAPWPRTTWAMSHLAVAAAGTTIVLAIMGASTGAGYAMMTGDLGFVIELCWAALLMVPAVFVIVGITAVIGAWWPRLALAAWGSLVAALVIGFFGAMLELPQWTLDLSPFEHVPALPASSVEVFPMVALSLTSAGLVGLALVGYRQRDIR